jgi:energy-coupling factor transporter ATP-binding protein EcfA2
MVSIPVELKKFVKEKITHCRVNECMDFEIHTFTVIPTDQDGVIPKRSSYGVLDDNTYVKYPELIKLIPRGLSVAYLNDEIVCKLDGLEKFDGSCPLDDDNECSSNIFKQNSADIANWKSLKVEFLEKANGKMAIFKIFCIKNTFFILGGSKNVHIVVGLFDEIKGTELHHQILKQFQKDLVDKDIKTLVDQTIIGEYVDGQHIVYVDQPYMVYFSGPLMNVKRLFPDQDSLPTFEQLTAIRNLENTEGAVVVYTNLDNGIVFRQKHKSIWYILIRVMREGLRHYTKQTDTNIIITKVFAIFKRRSDDFLSLTNGDFAKWYVILKNFVIFIKQSIYDFPDLDVQKMGIGAIYHEFTKADPALFLEQELRNLTVTDPYQDPFQDPLQIPQLRDYVKTLYDNGLKVCVILRGPTGSGKSTLVKELKKATLIQDLKGDTCIECFSTDDLFITDGEYKFEADKLESYHNQNFLNFRDAVVNDNYQAVCVDNTNIGYHEYGRYIELARNNGYVTVVFDCKKLAPEVLFARTTHSVPINSIIAKVKKYNFVDPQYYGIFFTEDSVLSLLNNCGIDYEPVQKTPLHITLFFGRDQINSVACKAIPMGQKYTVKVVSFCTGKAGKSLTVSLEGQEWFITKISHLHITLETHEGFKPVNVGTMTAEISVEINKEISGIYGPIY